MDTVGLLKWNDPSMPHFLMDIAVHGPSIWRTTTLWTISSETFWTLLRTLSRHLHGRQRMTFRRHMFAITGKMEQALQVGKVRTVLRAVPAVRAVLQESSPMFTHEALTVPGIGIYIYDHGSSDSPQPRVQALLGLVRPGPRLSTRGTECVRVGEVALEGGVVDGAADGAVCRVYGCAVS